MSAAQHQSGVSRHAVFAYAGYEMEMKTAEGGLGGNCKTITDSSNRQVPKLTFKRATVLKTGLIKAAYHRKFHYI